MYKLSNLTINQLLTKLSERDYYTIVKYLMNTKLVENKLFRYNENFLLILDDVDIKKITNYINNLNV